MHALDINKQSSILFLEQYIHQSPKIRLDFKLFIFTTLLISNKASALTYRYLICNLVPSYKQPKTVYQHVQHHEWEKIGAEKGKYSQLLRKTIMHLGTQTNYELCCFTYRHSPTTYSSNLILYGKMMRWCPVNLKQTTRILATNAPMK